MIAAAKAGCLNVAAFECGDGGDGDANADCAVVGWPMPCASRMWLTQR